MGREVHIGDVVDGDGFKFPKNMNTQFRNLQTGVEYLKDSADNITVELKSVGIKLNKHTTDLSDVTAKVNEIDKNLRELSKTISVNFNKTSQAFLALTDIIRGMVNEEDKPAKKKPKSPKKN